MSGSDLKGWAYVEILTVVEASFLAAGYYPGDPDGARAAYPFQLAMCMAIQRGEIETVQAYTREFTGELAPALPGESVDAEWTKVSFQCAAQYFGSKGEWPFSKAPVVGEEAKPVEGRALPNELQAALEAFRAVSNDPEALRGRSVKAALLSWLEVNKPGLSVLARERIATVANWRPSGGAPRTPVD